MLAAQQPPRGLADLREHVAGRQRRSDSTTCIEDDVEPIHQRERGEFGIAGGSRFIGRQFQIAQHGLGDAELAVGRQVGPVRALSAA